MSIKILAAGLNLGGAPLPVGAVIDIDAAAEAAFVATGKATYTGAGAFGQVLVLAQRSIQVAAPADTSDNAVWSTIIPGGLMGPNDSLRVYAHMSCDNNANNKTMRIRLGGATALSSVVTTAGSGHMGCRIANRSSQASQVVSLLTSATTSSVTALTANMAADQVLAVTIQKAVAGDNAALESVLVELLRAPS